MRLAGRRPSQRRCRASRDAVATRSGKRSAIHRFLVDAQTARARRRASHPRPDASASLGSVFPHSAPATVGQTVQRQTQQWLHGQGFDLPSVVAITDSRGAAARALRLDFLVLDSPQHCLEVVSMSRARPILIAPEPDDVTEQSAQGLQISVARSIGEALDMLEVAAVAALGSVEVATRCGVLDFPSLVLRPSSRVLVLSDPRRRRRVMTVPFSTCRGTRSRSLSSRSAARNHAGVASRAAVAETDPTRVDGPQQAATKSDCGTIAS